MSKKKELVLLVLLVLMVAVGVVQFAGRFSFLDSLTHLLVGLAFGVSLVTGRREVAVVAAIAAVAHIAKCMGA